MSDQVRTNVAAGQADGGLSRWILASLACVAACLALRGTAPTSADVSWLLDMGTQWLAGRRPYVDIVEVNPPASILIYMPAVVAARVFGGSPEIYTVVMAACAALASLLLTGLMLERAGMLARGAAGPLLCAGAIVVLLVPGDCFAQREHIAMLASLPMLAAIAARLRGVSLAWPLVALAGLCGGLTLAIKPLFVLAFAGPCLILLLDRDWRALVAAAELWIAGLLAALYGAGVLVGAPAFRILVLPLVLAAYVPVRLGLADLVTAATTTIWLTILAGWLMETWSRPKHVESKVLMLASAGFEICFFIQGKGFAYHALPAVSLALLAIACESCDRIGPAPIRRGLAPGLLIAGAMTGLSLVAFSQHYDLRRDAPGLEAAIRQVSPSPRMVVLSTDIAVGHPFVREINGHWTGSLASNWMASGIEKLERSGVTPATRSELDRVSDVERSIVAHDIENGRPDVVLIDSGLPDGWIDASPGVLRALSAYRKSGQYGPIALWIRAAPANPEASAAAPPARTDRL